MEIITADFAENRRIITATEEAMNEPTKKCKCGKSVTPGRGDYCLDCYFDAFGELMDDISARPPPQQTDPSLWSDKYAIILEMSTMPVLGTFIANFERPYRIPVGKENSAHNLLHKKGNMVIVADKQTLLDNPFDLVGWDFDNPQDLPEEVKTL